MPVFLLDGGAIPSQIVCSKSSQHKSGLLRIVCEKTNRENRESPNPCCFFWIRRLVLPSPSFGSCASTLLKMLRLHSISTELIDAVSHLQSWTVILPKEFETQTSQNGGFSQRFQVIISHAVWVTLLEIFARGTARVCAGRGDGLCRC